MGTSSCSGRVRRRGSVGFVTCELPTESRHRLVLLGQHRPRQVRLKAANARSSDPGGRALGPQHGRGGEEPGNGFLARLADLLHFAGDERLKWGAGCLLGSP